MEAGKAKDEARSRVTLCTAAGRRVPVTARWPQCAGAGGGAVPTARPLPSSAPCAGAVEAAVSQALPVLSVAALRRCRRRRGPHGAAVAELVPAVRDERVRGRPLGVAAGVELCVRVQRAADPPASPVVVRLQGAAEGCRAGGTDAGGDPGHEAGAGHHQHDGRVCQICQAGEEDQQNDGQAQNSREGADGAAGQGQMVHQRRLLRTAGSADGVPHLEVLLGACGRGAQQVDHPAGSPGRLSNSSGRWHWNHLLDFGV